MMPTRARAYLPAKPWTVNPRVIGLGLVGAAFLGALTILGVIAPVATDPAHQIALAIIPVVGIRFGAVAGFLTGCAGGAVSDQIGGAGLLTFWNWSVAEGLVGLIAGAAGYYLLQQTRLSDRIIRTAGIAVIAIMAGLTFTITDTLMGTHLQYWLTASYLPALINYTTVALLLVPIMDQIFEPLADRASDEGPPVA
jgi:energy-coupling factor transport system substrate-specific component